MFGSKTAQLGALEVQIVICGFPISGSSSVPARHADHVQPRIALRKHGRPACWAELAMHYVSTRGFVRIIRECTLDFDGIAREEDVDCA